MEQFRTLAEELINKHFSPTLTDRATEQALLTTAGIIQMLQGVIPEVFLTEADVSTILLEQGFECELMEIVKKKKNENDENDDFEQLPKRFVYAWILYLKSVL